MNRVTQLLLAIAAQFVLFIPFYIEWKKDCERIGKENLAASLKERFITWLICCPIWIIGLLK